jgi:polyisoprenoid-binding protein YceI
MNRLTFALAAVAAAALAAQPPNLNASYSADPQHSRLEFVGTQAGAPLRASIHSFTAAIDFSPDSLSAAHMDVLIDARSVDSQDADRDATMKGKDGLDVAQWPSAHYVSQTIAKSAAGFHATGSLTLHGVTRDVPIDFQFAAMPAGAKLEGSATLKRLDFGVGQGDWKSTEWIGDEVKINFSLLLVPRH